MPTALHHLPRGAHHLEMVNNTLSKWQGVGHPSKDFATLLQRKIDECNDLSSSKVKAIWEVEGRNGEWEDFLLEGFRTWLLEHYAFGAVKDAMGRRAATQDVAEQKTLMDDSITILRPMIPNWYRSKVEGQILPDLNINIGTLLFSANSQYTDRLSRETQRDPSVLDGSSVSFAPQTAAGTSTGGGNSSTPGASGASTMGSGARR